MKCSDDTERAWRQGGKKVTDERVKKYIERKEREPARNFRK